MPAKFRVRIARTAERDIEEIWGFIAADSPAEADRFIRRIETHIGTLERFPERCPLIAENELLGTRYRHLLLSHYRMIYRLTGKTVFVMRMIHGARLLDARMFEE
ncbi:MAG: type II toxin-antitoxin system RelE/ParE family toxin [Candidatus Binatia bacterium]